MIDAPFAQIVPLLSPEFTNDWICLDGWMDEWMGVALRKILAIRVIYAAIRNNSQNKTKADEEWQWATRCEFLPLIYRGCGKCVWQMCVQAM